MRGGWVVKLVYLLVAAINVLFQLPCKQLAVLLSLYVMKCLLVFCDFYYLEALKIFENNFVLALAMCLQMRWIKHL